MTLEFNPGAYESAFQFGQNRDQQRQQALAQALQAIPQGISAIGASQQAQKEARMNQLVTALKFKEQGIDPSNAMGYLATGKFPQQDQQPQQMPQMAQNPLSSTISDAYRPNFGQEASAGTPDTGFQMPQSSSSIIDAWKNHPNPSQFQPQGQNTMQKPTSGFASLFASAPLDYNGVIGDLKNNQYDSFNRLTEKQKGDLKDLPAYKQLFKETATGASAYSAEDLKDAEKGNWTAIASRNGGKIPSSLATLGESATSKTDATYAKKFKDAQDALTNVRGDQSIARTELQRDSAAMAYNTLQRIQSENRLPTQLEWHDIINQMLRARTGSFNEQAASALVQKTLQGKTGDVYTYFTGQTAPATSSELMKNLQAFVTESGLDAQKQHDAYMEPRIAKSTHGLTSEDQQSLSHIHRGLSFQEQTGYSPQASVITATNKQTGQKIQSSDGGKTWQPMK